MRKIIFSALLLVVVGELVYLYQLNWPKRTEVLSESVAVIPTEVPTPTPTVEPTPTPTPTPKATPLKTPTPVPIPTPAVQPTVTSQEINGFIERFAAQYSVSPDILRHIAVCESGFNPLAQKLSYAGLYQFGPVTWSNIRTKMGEDANIDLRFNAEEAVQTAAYNLHINNAGIWPNCVP